MHISLQFSTRNETDSLKYLGIHRITESQNVRGWKGPLWVIQSNPPAQAGSPTAGCRGPCPGRSWISPEKETPQPPWAACSSAPSPSEGRSSSSCSDRTVTLCQNFHDFRVSSVVDQYLREVICRVVNLHILSQLLSLCVACAYLH